MKRIYLVRNNETGAEELVRARSAASALHTLLSARNVFTVKVPTVDEALAISKTGQDVLDPDEDAEALEEVKDALNKVPSLDMPREKEAA